MKCTDHSELEALGTCQECHKNLCGDCVNRYEKPLCNNCLETSLSKESRRFYFSLVMTAVLFALGYYVWIRYFHGFVFYSLIPACIMGGSYWGWHFLTNILAKPVEKSRSTSMHLIVWTFYYVVKLIISLLIGVFVGIYKIGEGAQKLRQAGLLRQQINETT